MGIVYWQWHVRHEVSANELVADARQHYGYDVPTFRQALRHLVRSLIRKRIIAQAIPDVRAAVDYFEGRELMSVEEYDKPSEWEWQRHKEQHPWMYEEEGE